MTSETPIHAADVQLGKNIREARLLAGLSQEAVGAALNPPVSYQQVQKYEKGLNRISAAALVDIAKVCGVPVVNLYVGVSEVIAAGGGFVESITRNEGGMLREFREIRDPELQKLVRTMVSALCRDTAERMKA